MNSTTTTPKAAPRREDKTRKFGSDSCITRINLASPSGNSFSIGGVASSIANQLSWSDKRKSDMISEIFAGDYVNVCEVFEKYFGDIAQLYYSPEYSFTNQIRRCKCEGDECECCEQVECCDECGEKQKECCCDDDEDSSDSE
jgi:hypothetical protein